MEKRYCPYCGKEVHPEAVICVNCGCSLRSLSTSSGEISDAVKVAIKVFMILGTITLAFAIIPLIWCIPMYSKVNRYLEGEETLTIGFKVCVLLFVSFIAGIILLVQDN